MTLMFRIQVLYRNGHSFFLCVFFLGGVFHFLEAPQESYLFCCVIFDFFWGLFVTD